MKLPKAIEILKLNLSQRNHRMPPDVKDALTLGKEALERFQIYRKDAWHMANIPLPSETTEEEGR